MNHLTPMYFSPETQSFKPEGWDNGTAISFYPKTYHGFDKDFQARQLQNGEQWVQGCSNGWVYWYFKLQEAA